RAALLSFPAVWIAVSGRSRSNLYLHSQQVIAASASATLSIANSRALLTVLRPRSAAMERAMRFQWPGGVAVPSPSAQKGAMPVCSLVRFVQWVPPSSLTSAKAFANSSLVTAGGPVARNCEVLFRAKHATPDQPGSSAGRSSVGCQRAGSPLGLYA